MVDHTPKSRWRMPFINHESLLGALREVTTGDGIQASSRDSFKGAIFGRDSLEVGLDVVDHLPEMAHRILISVVRHIGLKHDATSEEEPGKGLHEHRARVIGGEPVADQQLVLMKKLSAMWGGTDDYVTYFGAADTGALYLDLLKRYVSIVGDDILDETFVHARTGETMTVRDSVIASANWYCANHAKSDIGLIEFCHTNPSGHWFQVMRDGHDGMVDGSGTQANPYAPIAAIEIQAVAHSGLTAAAALLKDHSSANKWSEVASNIRTRAIEAFWMDDEKYFARAIYRDTESGEPVVLRAIDSASAELLRSTIFDDMDEGRKQRFVGGIVERIFDSDFVTTVGPRMLSSRHRDLFDYFSYQGPNVVWPTITKRIADGLYKQGFAELGADLDARLIECCEQYGDFPEYVFVTDDGMPIFRTSPDGQRIVAAHRPMTVQAWTASGAFGAYCRDVEEAESFGWRADLTSKICKQLWKPYTAFGDIEAGAAAEQRFFDRMGHGTPAMASIWDGMNG